MVNSHSQDSDLGLDDVMTLFMGSDEVGQSQPQESATRKGSPAKSATTKEEDGISQLQEILVKPDIIELRQKFDDLNQQVHALKQNQRPDLGSVQQRLNRLQTDVVRQQQEGEASLSSLETRLDQQKQALTHLQSQVEAVSVQDDGSLSTQLNEIRQELVANRQLSEKVILPAIAQLQQDLQTNQKLQEKLIDVVGGELQTVVTQIEQKITTLSQDIPQPQAIVQTLPPILEDRFNQQLEAFQRVMMAKMTALTKEVVDLRQQVDEPQETHFSIQVTGVE